jgi:hypothetical protein
VGRFQPAAFPEFHHWLMAGVEPPPLERVRERAQALLGPLKLAEEIAKPENLRPLTLGVQTFGTNLSVNRLDGLPLLLTETAMFMGAPENMETWIEQFKRPVAGQKR